MKKWKNEDEAEKIFKEEESIEILKILGCIIIIYGWRKNKPRI